MFDPLIFMFLAYILYLILSGPERKEQKQYRKALAVKYQLEREKAQREKDKKDGGE
ncbi:MAG: hypothetical protein WCN92_09640 [Eubacteriales bacterium]